MIKDYFIIFNPQSGKGKSKKIVIKLKNEFKKRGIDYDIKSTQFPKHAIDICKNIKGYSARQRNRV